MELKDFISKTLRNRRGYKWGRSYGTNYEYPLFELSHYGTRILEVNLRKREVTGAYVCSMSDTQAINEAIRRLDGVAGFASMSGFFKPIALNGYQFDILIDDHLKFKRVVGKYQADFSEIVKLYEWKRYRDFSVVIEQLSNGTKKKNPIGVLTKRMQSAFKCSETWKTKIEEALQKVEDMRRQVVQGRTVLFQPSENTLLVGMKKEDINEDYMGTRGALYFLKEETQDYLYPARTGTSVGVYNVYTADLRNYFIRRKPISDVLIGHRSGVGYEGRAKLLTHLRDKSPEMFEEYPLLKKFQAQTVEDALRRMAE